MKSFLDYKLIRDGPGGPGPRNTSEDSPVPGQHNGYNANG